MLKLIIEDDEGRKTVVPFVRDEITIGRQEGNTIRLTERNVSRRHARLVRLNGHVVVEDLGSYNGTRINGERIAGQSPLKEGDLIQIGDYDLALQSEAGASTGGGPITTKVPSATPSSLRKTEPAMEAMGDEPDPEQDDEASASGEEDGDGDEHDHTPPSSSADQRRHSTSIIRLDQVEADRPRRVEDVAAEDAPRLVVLAPDEFKGQEFACIRTELRIGRTDDNDIALDHRSLSRTHVKLVREDSGEWRVIDMQSANGLTVNGESYAQATLGSGDIIELGHVKLRFLQAGDAADDVPASAGGSRSKMPLVAGLIALVLGGAGAAFFVLRPPASPEPVKVAVEDTPEAPEQEAPEQVKAPPANAAAAAEPVAPPPETPPEPAGPSITDQLASAQQALDQGRFDQAETLLSNIKDARGAQARDVERLLTSARYEKAARKQLDTARQAVATNKFAEARQALDASADTQHFAQEHASLESELKAAQDKAAAAAARPTPPPPNPVQPASDTVPAEDSPVTQALAEGKQYMREKKYALAVRRLKECIQVAPTPNAQAECYLFLGGAYAAEKKPDESVEAYRQFLKLAPDHPNFNKVKGFVESYEASKP